MSELFGTSRNDQFNAWMLSLDEFIATFDDPSKIAHFSDRGETVEKLVDHLDDTEGLRTIEEWSEWRKRKIEAAEKRVRRAGRKDLLPILRLIIENGKDRVRTIKKIRILYKLSYHAAEKAYYRGRNQLLELFFCPKNV